MINEEKRVKRLEQVREAVKRKRLQTEYREEERSRKRIRYHLTRKLNRECENASKNDNKYNMKVELDTLREKRRKTIRDIVKRRRECFEVRECEREKDREAKKKKRVRLRIKHNIKKTMRKYRRRIQLSNEERVLENFQCCKYLKRRCIIDNIRWIIHITSDYNQVERMVKLGFVGCIRNVIVCNISNRCITTIALSAIRKIMELRVFHRSGINAICTEAIKYGWVSMLFVIMNRHKEKEIIELCLDILRVVTENQQCFLETMEVQETGIIGVMEKYKDGRMLQMD
jgi:hypothetical protein